MAEDAQAISLLASAAKPSDDPQPAPRALIVVAHPDDESIALGARLRRYRSALFLQATDGAPLDGADAAAHGFRSLDAYRAARRRELECALRLAGIAPERARQLAIADQRAAHELPQLTRAVLESIREAQPEVILTHPYEGGHPDHDACAFAVHTAVKLLAPPTRPPVIIEAAFYHQGPQGIETGRFLSESPSGAEMVCQLKPEERARKEALFACFVTQQRTLQYFPRDVERFRIAPRYDFTQPPHPGALFYEHYPWGMTGAHFCTLAAQAQSALGVEAAACD